MTNNRGFWVVSMLALLALYAAALVLVAQGHYSHRLVLLAAIILAAHALEIPLAFHMLKARRPRALRVVFSTLLFGLVWWVPARRGIVPVS
ncbi:MAG TPA: hypothetical protein VM369_02690 [Candidatus Binatia bacterium]|nr:hypothetical protein [Candidatus Binatia bacterium]